MGPYWLQVLVGEALPEVAIQDSFLKSPTPTVEGVAEVCSSAWFSADEIYGDRSLGGLNYSGELALWHLQTTGNAATLRDMTAFRQDQSSKYLPVKISAETTSGRPIREGFSGLRRQQLHRLGHHRLGHHRLGHHHLLCDVGHRDCHPGIRQLYPLRIEFCRHPESSPADH